MVSNLLLPTNQLSQITVSESDVWSALTSVDPDKTNGRDTIGPRLLRECTTLLAAPFSILFNACLIQRSIPEERKVYMMALVFKNGHKTDVNN